ncbi:MAG: alanine--tRNA ligase [Gammaproteobacteria bacterium AqS3]|nr:alanine--tRNA ligase [Gammaproteobacteria bacterium AqS3]
MHSSAIRETFLDYFEQRGHRRVPSASLIPADDPSILFTNAGMAPFKNTFLGLEKRDYARAASAQRCVRAGGKHNDLENVGRTARHQTFFEMLGNFSFGDYFKSEAIDLAWGLLRDGYALPAERLWITVHEDDDEAAEHWLRWVPAERIIRLGDDDNFWSMGPVGPCGPCSEVFYDHGESVPGGPPGSPEADGDRYVEIWNLVFMQQERCEDGSTTPLPRPSVDTGMGLERMATVLQGVMDNYQTDLFTPLIKSAAEALGVANDPDEVALRVIADHIRSCTFLLYDGALPGNEGRGYVLRRILRRAVRHGYQLGCREPFLHRLTEPLVRQFAELYPDLARRQQRISEAILNEESLFAKTLHQGMELLGAELKRAPSTLDGELIFMLYDTYGFPVDMTADIASEAGIALDLEGYERAMEVQRSRGRSSSRKAVRAISGEGARQLPPSEFLGYDTGATRSRIAGLLGADGNLLERAGAGGQQVALVLERTPFYAEAGGQIGDVGSISGSGFEFAVEDTQRSGEIIVHHGTLSQGELAPGIEVEAQIDAARRAETARHHSATHLLNAALHEVLGEGISQRGSMVGADYLRFDITHPSPISSELLERIETIVNRQILANTPASTVEMPLQQALDAGARAVFDEKYGDVVRVLSMGTDDFSVELCGGTHVSRTGDIGLFVITAESSIAAGVRRIEALAGESARRWLNDQRRALEGLARRLGCGIDESAERLEAVFAKSAELQQALEEARGSQLENLEQSLAAGVEMIGAHSCLLTRLDVPLEGAELRNLGDRLRQKIQVVVLASGASGEVRLLIGVDGALHEKVQAGALMRELAGALGGKGGGRDDFAQGGAADWDGAPAALDVLRTRLLELLA